MGKHSQQMCSDALTRGVVLANGVGGLCRAPGTGLPASTSAALSGMLGALAHPIARQTKRLQMSLNYKIRNCRTHGNAIAECSGTTVNCPQEGTPRPFPDTGLSKHGDPVFAHLFAFFLRPQKKR